MENAMPENLKNEGGLRGGCGGFEAKGQH